MSSTSDPNRPAASESDETDASSVNVGVDLSSVRLRFASGVAAAFGVVVGFGAAVAFGAAVGATVASRSSPSSSLSSSRAARISIEGRGAPRGGSALARVAALGWPSRRALASASSFACGRDGAILDAPFGLVTLAELRDCNGFLLFDCDGLLCAVLLCLDLEGAVCCEAAVGTLRPGIEISTEASRPKSSRERSSAWGGPS